MTFVPPPYPYFGGKRRALDLIWSLLGPVDSFTDPFGGSCVVPLNAPHALKRVVVGDINGLIVNAWRAMAADPDAVAAAADWPTFHLDLLARDHVLRREAPALPGKLEADPRFFDAELAGWWLWSVSNSIDMGASLSGVGRAPNVSIPSLGSRRGVRVGSGSSIPRVLDHPAGQGVTAQRRDPGGRRPPVDAGAQRVQGVNANHAGLVEAFDPDDHGARLRPWMREIQRRVHGWYVLCRSWERILGSASMLGIPPPTSTITGLLLDPPYDAGEGRSEVYAHDDLAIASQVRQWLRTPDPKTGVEPWANPRLRIVVCGFDGDFDDAELPGARKIAWKSTAGMAGTGGPNPARKQEMLWASPSCLGQERLL